MKTIIFAIIALSITSCATIVKIAKETEACAASQYQKYIPGLLPVVVSVLSGAEGLAQAALAALEVGVEGGEMVVMCAVDSAVADVDAKMLAMQKTAAPNPISVHGHAYLTAKGFKQKH